MGKRRRGRRKVGMLKDVKNGRSYKHSHWIDKTGEHEVVQDKNMKLTGEGEMCYIQNTTEFN